MSTLSVLESTPSALVIKLLWTLASKVLTASALLDIRVILTSTTSCVPCVQIQGHVLWYEDCGKKIDSFFDLLNFRQPQFTNRKIDKLNEFLLCPSQSDILAYK